jgi:hypothetical protein
MSSIKLLLVGTNPSSSSPDNSAFHPSTKSRKFIDKIFEDQYFNISYINLIDYKTEKNRPISITELRSNLENIKQKFHHIYDTKIITFGKTASEGLTLAGIDHFAMPHPSGLCRFWNDGMASEAKIKEMLSWIATF